MAIVRTGSADDEMMEALASGIEARLVQGTMRDLIIDLACAVID